MKNPPQSPFFKGGSKTVACPHHFELHVRCRPQLTDGNDEFVLEAAVNAGHVPLITHNTRDFMIATKRFNLLVFTPGQFLRKFKP